MTDREWWTQLDQHGKAWRVELAKNVGADPSDAQLKKLLASTAGWSPLLGLKRLEAIHTHSEIMTKPDQAAFKKRKVDVSL